MRVIYVCLCLEGVPSGPFVYRALRLDADAAVLLRRGFFCGGDFNFCSVCPYLDNHYLSPRLLLKLLDRFTSLADHEAHFVSGYHHFKRASHRTSRGSRRKPTTTTPRSSTFAADDPIDGSPRFAGKKNKQTSVDDMQPNELMSIKVAKSTDAYAIAAGVPLMVHCLSGIPCESGAIWILHPVSFCKRVICSPPLPMIRPTILSGTIMVSSDVGPMVGTPAPSPIMFTLAAN